MKNAESIDQWGTFITTPVITNEIAKVNVKTRVTGKSARLITQIIDGEGRQVAADSTNSIFGNEFEQNIAVSYPKRWSPNSTLRCRDDCA